MQIISRHTLSLDFSVDSELEIERQRELHSDQKQKQVLRVIQGSNMSLLYSPNLQYQEADFRKNQNLMMESGTHFNQHHQQQQQQQQHNSGLSRYQSAPSSFFGSLVNGDDSNINEDYRYFRSTSPELDDFVAKYMLPSDGSGESGSHHHRQFGEKAVKQEEVTETMVAQQNSNNNNNSNNDGYSNGSSSQQMVYQSMQIQETGNNSFGAANSVGNGGNGTNLVRQNSSPAGFFSNPGVDNGFGVMREMGCYKVSNGSNGESSSKTSQLNSPLNFPSRTSSGILPRISEIGSENPAKSFGRNNGSDFQYAPNFPSDSWDHTSISGQKRGRENDRNIFFGSNTLETQNGSSVDRSSNGLIHHLSLPKDFGEMASAERFMQFQGGGSVPCKIRAKRGFATHPRSIAERVRRTRISERMRKLQELFPDLDKQTSTADMLDMAVEHIKGLQKQVQALEETKTKCRCSSSIQNQHSNMGAS